MKTERILYMPVDAIDLNLRVAVGYRDKMVRCGFDPGPAKAEIDRLLELRLLSEAVNGPAV